MAALFRRLLAPCREFGLTVGMLYLVDRALRSFSPRVGLQAYELMEQPIDGRALLPVTLARNLEFVDIGPGHPALEQMPARADIKASRFAQGARCMGVYRKGELLGYLWWCPGRYDEDEVRCTYHLEPAEQSVFDFDLYVMPQHRLGIAFMAIWHGANQWLHARGVRHSFSRVTLFNLASRRAHARLGGRRIGGALFMQLYRFELMFSSVPPHFGFTWRTSDRLALRLSPAGATRDA